MILLIDACVYALHRGDIAQPILVAFWPQRSPASSRNVKFKGEASKEANQNGLYWSLLMWSLLLSMQNRLINHRLTKLPDLRRWWEHRTNDWLRYTARVLPADHSTARKLVSWLCCYHNKDLYGALYTWISAAYAHLDWDLCSHTVTVTWEIWRDPEMDKVIMLEICVTN